MKDSISGDVPVSDKLIKRPCTREAAVFRRLFKCFLHKQNPTKGQTCVYDQQQYVWRSYTSVKMKKWSSYPERQAWGMSVKKQKQRPVWASGLGTETHWLAVRVHIVRCFWRSSLQNILRLPIDCIKHGIRATFKRQKQRRNSSARELSELWLLVNSPEGLAVAPRWILAVFVFFEVFYFSPDISACLQSRNVLIQTWSLWKYGFLWGSP